MILKSQSDTIPRGEPNSSSIKPWNRAANLGISISMRIGMNLPIFVKWSITTSMALYLLVPISDGSSWVMKSNKTSQKG